MQSTRRKQGGCRTLVFRRTLVALWRAVLCTRVLLSPAFPESKHAGKARTDWAENKYRQARHRRGLPLGFSDRFSHSGPCQLEQVLTGHIDVVSLAGAQNGAQHEHEVRHVDDAENVNSFGFEGENAGLCLQSVGCN